jgi:hypothetical protein
MNSMEAFHYDKSERIYYLHGWLLLALEKLCLHKYDSSKNSQAPFTYLLGARQIMQSEKKKH